MSWLGALLKPGRTSFKWDDTKRLTGSERNDLFRKQKGLCYYCDKPMHKRPEYPDDRNSDMAWFTVARDRDMKKVVGACRLCNNTQRHLE